ncbi:hypothetical protein VaNZ11_006050 [Volvox africanus]|uniref:RAP domain-containing protein n=1 Tax=Volvox africanus TaxID=51714 RepID=A0ABQ5S1E3_9CHLO|nr:hypothetical protein VaNZ11_006050 [Volvox africanus]
MRAGPNPLDTSGQQHPVSNLLSLRRCNHNIRVRRLGSLHVVSRGVREPLRRRFAARALAASPDHPLDSSDLTLRLLHARAASDKDFPLSDHLSAFPDAEASGWTTLAPVLEQPSPSLPWREGVTDQNLVASTSSGDCSKLAACHTVDPSDEHGRSTSSSGNLSSSIGSSSGGGGSTRNITMTSAATSADSSDTPERLHGRPGYGEDDANQTQFPDLLDVGDTVTALGSLSSVPDVRRLSLSGGTHSVSDLTACVSRWLEGSGTGLRHWLLTALQAHHPPSVDLFLRDGGNTSTESPSSSNSVQPSSATQAGQAWAAGVAECIDLNGSWSRRQASTAAGIHDVGQETKTAVAGHVELAGPGACVLGLDAGAESTSRRAALDDDSDDVLFAQEPFSDQEDDDAVEWVTLSGVDVGDEGRHHCAKDSRGDGRVKGGVCVLGRRAATAARQTMEQQQQQQWVSAASDQSAPSTTESPEAAAAAAGGDVLQLQPTSTARTTLLTVLGKRVSETLGAGPIALNVATPASGQGNLHIGRSKAAPSVLDDDHASREPMGEWWTSTAGVSRSGFASNYTGCRNVSLAPPPVRRTSSATVGTPASSSNGSNSRGLPGFFYRSEEAEWKSSSESSSMSPARLTWELSHAADWRRVSVLVQLYLEHLDCIHVSAALVRLAKLHRSDAAALTVIEADIPTSTSVVPPLPQDGSCFSSSNSASSAGARFAKAWAKSRARAVAKEGSDGAWLAAIEERRLRRKVVERHPGGACPASSLLSSDKSSKGQEPKTAPAGRPRIVHPDVTRLILSLLARVPGLMPRADYRTVSNMLWALGVLRPLTASWPRCRDGGGGDSVFPRVTTTAAVLAAKMRHFWQDVEPRALALALWGLARLGMRPGPVWIAEFECASMRLLPRFNARELSCSLWALAALRLRPDALWLTLVQRVIVTMLDIPASASNLRSVATLLWAFAVLRVQLDGPAAAAMLSALNGSLHAERTRTGPQVLCMAIWACARLGLRPEGDLLAAWRQAASGPVLAAAPARAVSCMLWSLARLHCVPPGSWVDEAAAALLARAQESGLGRQSLCLAVGSLAHLDSRISPEWLRDFTAAAPPLLQQLDSSELGMVLHGLGRMVKGGGGVRGGNAASQEDVAAEFIAAADTAAAVVLPSASAADVAGIAGGLAALGAVRSTRLHDAFIRQATELLRTGSLEPRHAAVCLAFLAASARSTARCPVAATRGGGACTDSGSSTGVGIDGAPERCHDTLHACVPVETKQPLPPPQPPPSRPQRRLVLELLGMVLAAELDEHDVYDVSQALCAAAELGIVAVTPFAKSAVIGAAARVCGRAPGARPLLRLLQGMYGLRVRPPETWLKHVASQVGRRLRSLTGDELELMLRLLGAMQLRKSAAAEATAPSKPPATKAAEPKANLAGKASASETTTRGGPTAGPVQAEQHQQQRQKVLHPPSALTALLSAARPALAAAPIQHLMQLVSALVAATTGPIAAAAADTAMPATTRALPPPLAQLELPTGWMQAFESATVTKLSHGCVTGASLVELLACFAVLGHTPGAEWAAAWYDSTARRLRGLRPTHLCMALQLQRRLGLHPPLVWLREHAAALLAAATGQHGRLQLPPLEVLAAVAELQRLGLDDAVLAEGPWPDTAAAPQAAALSGLVAAAATQLHEEMLAAEPAAQLATLATLQTIADPRTAAPVPHAEGWAVGVLAMVHSVIAQRPLHLLLSGLRPIPPPAPVLGLSEAADGDVPSYGISDGIGLGVSGAIANQNQSSEPIVVLLASMARWGHAPDHRWLSGIARHVCRQAELAAASASGAWPAADAARAVCCLAALGYVPDAAVSERLQQLLQPALAAGGLPPGLAAELCCAWAMVGRRPRPAWWRAAEEGVLAPGALADLTAPALLRLPYSMAQLGHVPSYKWFACYLTHLPAALMATPPVAPAAVPGHVTGAPGTTTTANNRGTRAADLSNLAWALGSAVHEGSYPPNVLSSSGALQALLAATEPLLRAMGPGQLVLLVEGLARCSHRLPQNWVSIFTGQVARQLHACGPSDLISFLYCLAFLDAQLSVRWLLAALRRTAQLLPPLLRSAEAYRADDLAWAVAKLDPRGSVATPFLDLLERQRFTTAATATTAAVEPMTPPAWFLRALGRDGSNPADASGDDGADIADEIGARVLGRPRAASVGCRDRQRRCRSQVGIAEKNTVVPAATATKLAELNDAVDCSTETAEGEGRKLKAATQRSGRVRSYGRGGARRVGVGAGGVLRVLRVPASRSES